MKCLTRRLKEQATKWIDVSTEEVGSIFGEGQEMHVDVSASKVSGVVASACGFR